MTYENKAKAARLKVLEMIHKAGTSHVASNLSVIDIATVLYDNLEKEDVVVWSAGWKSASIYYFMAQRGEIPVEDLEKFSKEQPDGSIPYLGLAETNIPGVMVNGGSVGHGLPIAAGMALGKKRAGEKGKVYCIMSDGEMNEGTVWESAMFAAHHKLDNLVAIVDNNKWQAMGSTKEVCDLDIRRAFTGFGWMARGIDGHNYNEIDDALTCGLVDCPFVIVADTVKGKGVSFMSNHLLYHYKHVDEETYKKAVAEII